MIWIINWSLHHSGDLDEWIRPSLTATVILWIIGIVMLSILGMKGISTLVSLLLVSFIFMVLSGIFFAIGLPEDWARGLFMATVVLWFALGTALIIDSFWDTRRYAEAAPAASSKADKEEGKDAD